MKSVSSVVAALTLSVSTLSIRAEWAFISLLRGTPTAKTEYQRVAFVGPAVVKDVQGKAERLCGIDCWSPVTKGMSLRAGDLVRVENESVLVMKMSGTESFVKVTPNTLFRLLPEDKMETVPTAASAPSGFVVRSCRGTAAYRDENGEWRPVQVNSVLPETAVVRTEAQTTVDLFCTSTHRAMRIQGARQLNLATAGTGRSSEPALASATR